MKDEKEPVLNLAAIELCYAPPVAEMLEHGTAGEVREALGSIARLLKAGRAADIGPTTQALLAAAFEQIAAGENGNAALGLNRKKKQGCWSKKNTELMIADLRGQGLTREKALEFIGSLKVTATDDGRGQSVELIEYEDGSTAERLAKRLQRYRTK